MHTIKSFLATQSFAPRDIAIITVGFIVLGICGHFLH